MDLKSYIRIFNFLYETQKIRRLITQNFMFLKEESHKLDTFPHLHHHGGVGHVSPPLLRPGPAHQRVGLIVVQGEAAEPGEPLLDLPHGLDLLLEDGQRVASPLKDGNGRSPLSRQERFI